MCLYGKKKLQLSLTSLVMFFGIIFSACNDCDNGENTGLEDLIYFSARDNSTETFSGFIFDPENLFIDNIFSNGKIIGFSNNRVLFSRESNELNSLFLFDEDQGSEQLVFEEIEAIEIENPASNLETDVITFFGDNNTIYQTDLTGNLIVLSGQALSQYQMQISSNGSVAFIEEFLSEYILKLVNKDGNVLQELVLSDEPTEEENRISWNKEETNLIYSLKSSEGSTVYRTRVDGFNQKLFDVAGQRVTKPFFASEELIGYYNVSRNQIEIRNLLSDEVTVIHSATSEENIIDLNWSVNSSRLFLEINYNQTSEIDLYYFDLNIQDNNIVSFEQNLLINDGFKAYSK